jgi:hypothetical protein
MARAQLVLLEAIKPFEYVLFFFNSGEAAHEKRESVSR